MCTHVFPRAEYHRCVGGGEGGAHQASASMSREVQDVVESRQLVELLGFLDADGTGAPDLCENLDGVAYLALESIPTGAIQTFYPVRSQRATLDPVAASLAW
ncbi:unnamed protein product [Prorocentrum cordatum]|uniref:Uncharacterized protein n=1 Tax=Prorocentrum cordatum TaxID=2364126 RepID=A0ABN9P877_9DINO|nr:unnamed protein product [Polarella glacialis]